MQTLVANDGDTVALWKDKSGNGFHFSNPTIGLQPTYRTGVFGPSAAVLGDGLQTYLHNSTYSVGTTKGITVYVVTKAVGTSAFQSIFSAYPGSGSATTGPDAWDLETWTSTRWLMDRFDTDTDGLLAAKTAAASDFTQPQIVTSAIDLASGVGKIVLIRKVR